MIHCDWCHCPADIWEPLKAYPSDNSCVFYSDIFDIVWDIEEKTGDNHISYEDFECECLTLKDNYPDIKDFAAAVRECYDIMTDSGVIRQLKFKEGNL